jgi:hypothetical protein
VREHKIIPQFIETHSRYQCRVCHSWIQYSEADGRWWHARAPQPSAR